MIGRKRIAACAGVACIVLAPAAAQAKTKTVDMGTPRTAQKTLGDTYRSDANDYFPHSVAINVGDSVKFNPSGFHTVDLPGKGAPLPFIGTGGPVSGPLGLDALGAPFWFNGQPVLSFNPALLKPLFGKSASYNGNKRVNSGLPLQERPKPMTVKFTKKGAYRYFCNLHPGMRGIVRVLPKDRKVPTAAQDRRTVQAQVVRAITTARSLPSVTPPAGTVYVGSSGRGGVEYFGMVPATATVPTGTTLTFRMSPGSYEDHTATFGPGDPENDPASYLGQIAAGFNSPQFDPRATYPSEAPGVPATLTPALHGNGFWNSGVLDASSATPLPDGNSVTFGEPGTYTYFCLIHPFMKGTVVVQ